VKLVVATMVPRGSVLPSNARTRTDQFNPLGVQYPDLRDGENRVFTGNMNLQALEETLQRGNVALVGLQAFADGQHPFSLDNLRAIRSLADRHGVRLICDGSRVVEDAC
jgi:tryptophanase